MEAFPAQPPLATWGHPVEQDSGGSRHGAGDSILFSATTPVDTTKQTIHKMLLTKLNYFDSLNTVAYSATICLCFMFQNRPTCQGRAVLSFQNRMDKRSQSRSQRKRTLRMFFAYAFAAWLAQGFTACSTPKRSTEQRGFQKRYQAYRYCDFTRVKQSSQTSCGAAALTSVLNYWKDSGQPDFEEKALVAQTPPRSPEGYPILQLRKMALENGVAAFAVTLDENPWKQLVEHVDKGRPVITAVRLPRGRYFGKTLPLVETLDRRTLMTTGSEWKSHYVVVIGRNYKNVILMDPDFGIVHTSRDAFLDFWRQESYAALICSALPSAATVPAVSSPSP